MNGRKPNLLLPLAMLLFLVFSWSDIVSQDEPTSDTPPNISIVSLDEMPPLPPIFSLPSGEPFCGAISQVGPDVFGQPFLWLAETNGQRYLVMEAPITHQVAVMPIPGESNGGCLPSYS